MVVGCFYPDTDSIHWEIQHQTYGGMEVLDSGRCGKNDDVASLIRSAMKKL
jgi:hypothetical protein